MIRCNNCMALFEDEDDLRLMEVDGEYIHACPNCKTDEYLMDLECEMKCPYCDKEIDDIDAHEDDLDYREYWYSNRVETVRGFQCPHCSKVLVLKEIYRLESSRFLGTKESE